MEKQERKVMNNGPLALQARIHPVKLACEANNPDLEFVMFWTPKSNKFLTGIASKPLMDRREAQTLITHTLIYSNGVRELTSFGFSCATAIAFAIAKANAVGSFLCIKTKK